MGNQRGGMDAKGVPVSFCFSDLTTVIEPAAGTLFPQFRCEGPPPSPLSTISMQRGPESLRNRSKDQDDTSIPFAFKIDSGGGTGSPPPRDLSKSTPGEGMTPPSCRLLS
jgi:hypothetical protein